MKNEQVQTPSRGFTIFAKICGFILVGIFVCIPFLEYFGNGGKFHPRGITVVLALGLITSMALAAVMLFVFEVFLPRHEWLAKYIAIFCGVTTVSAIPVKEHFEPGIPATFVTLGYAALIGIIACILVAAALALFHRFRPARTN